MSVHTGRAAALLGLVAIILAPQPGAAADQVTLAVNGKGKTLVFGKGGAAHVVDIGRHVSAAQLDEVKVLGSLQKSGTLHVLARVSGPSQVGNANAQCGAGIETDIVFLKIDADWKLKLARVVQVESCWKEVAPCAGADAYAIEQGVLIGRVCTDDGKATSFLCDTTHLESGMYVDTWQNSGCPSGRGGEAAELLGKLKTDQPALAGKAKAVAESWEKYGASMSEFIGSAQAQDVCEWHERLSRAHTELLAELTKPRQKPATLPESRLAAADAKLNAAYQKVMKAVDPRIALQLRVAQRRWIPYRDAMAALAAGVHGLEKDDDALAELTEGQLARLQWVMSD